MTERKGRQDLTSLAAIFALQNVLSKLISIAILWCPWTEVKNYYLIISTIFSSILRSASI